MPSVLPRLFIAAAIAAALSTSCALGGSMAVLWTDTPEILAAAEMFNASQDRHRIVVSFEEDLATSLSRAADSQEELPALALGRGLRTSSLKDAFAGLDHLFGGLGLEKEAFYPSLLAAGVLDERQVLLPVSFNALLLISRRDSPGGNLETLEAPALETPLLGLDGLRRNLARNPAGEAAMGFSPRWPDRDFLFQFAQQRGAMFAERTERRDKVSSPAPLSWSAEGLEKAARDIGDFIQEFNVSKEKEDAFAFRYLSAPTYRNVESGRLLYGAMDSSAYFLLSPVSRARLGFSYFGENGMLFAREDIRYLGILKKAKGKRAAEKFILWFFDPRNQQALLERSKIRRSSESSFGIAGGFSALKPVTASDFPSFYPELRGRTPPPESVAAPAAMPPGWERLKDELVIPWLSDGGSRSEDFALRLDAYLKGNPELRQGY